MSKDIAPILEGWDHKPDQISARIIKGDDGKEKIQLRLDMGLLQMDVEGRPDGKRPHGKESLLEYYEELIEAHKAKRGTDAQFKLDTQDCAMLHQEAVQYYYRYLSLFQLGRYAAVEKDTERNLRAFDLVARYAAQDEDNRAFERYTPYVLMMNTRAKGAQLLEKKEYDEALKVIEAGIERIEAFYGKHDRPDAAKESREMAFLRAWAGEVKRNRPPDRIETLEQELKEAVDREEYEKAAELRDELRRLRGGEARKEQARTQSWGE